MLIVASCRAELAALWRDVAHLDLLGSRPIAAAGFYLRTTTMLITMGFFWMHLSVTLCWTPVEQIFLLFLLVEFPVSNNAIKSW